MALRSEISCDGLARSFWIDAQSLFLGGSPIRAKHAANASSTPPLGGLGWLFMSASSLTLMDERAWSMALPKGPLAARSASTSTCGVGGVGPSEGMLGPVEIKSRELTTAGHGGGSDERRME